MKRNLPFSQAERSARAAVERAALPTLQQAWSRREFVKFMGLAAGGLMLSGCGAVQSVLNRTGGREKPLRIGYLPITDAGPLLAAHGLGLYQEEGLEVEDPILFRGWSQIAEAFMARQVDVIHVLMPTAVWMRFAQRQPIRLVAWNHTDGSALTVAPGVSQMADLGGQTVAIPFWYSIHNVVLQEMMRRRGLRVAQHDRELAPDEVRLVVMPPPDMPPALAGGAIAGYIVAEPFNAASEVAGVGKILRFTGDVWLRHACCVVVMHEEDLEERPEWSQAVVNAIVKAQRWMRENREEAAGLLSTAGRGYLPQPVEAIRRTFLHYPADEYGAAGAIRHPEWGSERIDFVPYPFPSYTEALVRFLQQTYVEGDRAFLAALDPAEAHRSLVEDAFVRRAIDAAGGLEPFGLPSSLMREEVISV